MAVKTTSYSKIIINSYVIAGKISLICIHGQLNAIFSRKEVHTEQPVEVRVEFEEYEAYIALFAKLSRYKQGRPVLGLVLVGWYLGR